MNCIRQFRVNIKVSFKGCVLQAFLFILCLSNGTFPSFKTAVYAGSVKRKNPPAVEKRIDSEQTNYTKTKILVKFNKDNHPQQVLCDLGIANRGIRRILGDKTLASRERKHLRKSKKKTYNIQGKLYHSLDKVPEQILAHTAYNRLSEKEQNLFRWYTITLAGKEKDIPGLIEKIKCHPGVENAQPNYTYIPYSLQPNDPYYSSSGAWGQDYLDLWNVHKINAASAWEVPVTSGPTPDITGDGVINFLDYSLVAGNSGNTGGAITPAGADINEDGVVDYRDLRLIIRHWVSKQVVPNLTPDINGDGIVNFLDFSLVAGNLGNTGSEIIPAGADINADGVVDHRDLRVIALNWISRPRIVIINPDVNGDRIVNYLDFTIVAGNWGKCGGDIHPAEADITQDGVVDYRDVAKISQRWLMRGNTDSGVVVAVVDTGLDYNHADIFSNVWVNAGEVSDNNGDGVIDLHDLDADGDYRVSEAELLLASDGVDDDDNALTDDFFGWNFNREDIPPDEIWQYGDYNDVSGNNNPMDTHGHGTHVSGIIAAVGNNNVGIIGVAPESRIMPLRADPLSDDNLVYALYYAGRNGARVINNSWGPKVPRPSSPALENTVEVLADVYDCVVVFAAGNNNDNVSGYSPNNHKKVITVASTDIDDVKSDFSNYGDLINVSAPGGNSWEYAEPNAPTNWLYPFANVVSLRSSGIDANDPDLEIFSVGERYIRKYGTSMAAPAVSGLAAILRQYYPYDTWEDILWKVCLGSDDVGTLGKDIDTGWGRINCYKSLLLNPQPALTITGWAVSEVVGDGDGKIEVGETGGVVVTVKSEWYTAFSVAGTMSCSHPSISIIDSSVDFGDVPAGREVTNSQPLTFKVTEAFSLDDYDPGFKLTITSSNSNDIGSYIPATITQINTQLIHDIGQNVDSIYTNLATDGMGKVYLKWNEKYLTGYEYRGLHVSHDFGYTWEWLPPPFGIIGHIWGDSFICDSAGNVFGSSVDNESYVRVYASYDHGLTWNIKTFSDRPDAKKHRILADGIDGVYFASMAGDYQICFNYSYNNGLSWGPRTLALPSNETVDGYAMDVDNNGNLYHSWYRWGESLSLVKFNRSLDRGVSWDNSFDTIGTYESAVKHYSVISDDSGHVYVLWYYRPENAGGNRYPKVLFNYSHDYGDNWLAEPLVIFSMPDVGSDTGLQSISFLNDDNGNVYFIGNVLRNPVIFRASRDYGQTWSELRELSFKNAKISAAVADDQGRVGLIFISSDNKVYFKYSNDYGETWKKGKEIRLAAYSDGVDALKLITDGKGKFYGVWVVGDEEIWVSTLVVPLNSKLASNPNPTDRATGVSRTADLSWTAGPSPTTHDVYFGTDNPPPFIGNQSSTTFDPGTMAYGTRYYWRIDEVGPYGTITGILWSFWTLMPPPP